MEEMPETDPELPDYVQAKPTSPQELLHTHSQELLRKCSTDFSFFSDTREQVGFDCTMYDFERQAFIRHRNTHTATYSSPRCECKLNFCTICMQNASVCARQDSNIGGGQCRNECSSRSTLNSRSKCKSAPVIHNPHKQSPRVLNASYSYYSTRTLPYRLLHLLLTALFITSLSPTALATPNTNTHLSPPSLSPVQHTAQPSSPVRDIFLSPDKWRVEEIGAEGTNSLMPDINKVTISLQTTVAFVGRLFQSKILLANYKPDSEDATIRYTATEAGSNSLPSWLHLDRLTGELAGVPLPKNEGNIYLSIDVRFSHTSKEESKHEALNEVFLISVLGMNNLISETSKSEKPPSVVLGKTNDQMVSSCASKYNFPTHCELDESPIVANIIFLSDFNVLKPQHRANLYLSVSDLVGICPDQIWLQSIDWTTSDGMKLWTQLADADFKQLLSHATILSFRIDCSKDDSIDFSFDESALKLIGILESSLTICSNGLALDENAYVNVDCYQWFITSSASSIIHQVKVSPESVNFVHKRRLKRQEETEDIEVNPNDQVPPPSTSPIVPTSSQSIFLDMVVTSTSTTDSVPSSSSQTNSDSTGRLPQVTTLQQRLSSISVAAPLSRVVPSSDGLTLVPSQTNPTTSSRRTSLLPLSTQGDLFNMLTSMPQFVMSSFIDFESITTMVEMVITPTPTRTFSFSVPSSIDVIDSSSMVALSSASRTIVTTINTSSSTISSEVTSTMQTTSRLTSVATLSSSSVAASITSLSPSSTLLSMLSPTPSLTLSSSEDVTTPFQSPSLRTTFSSLIPTPSSSFPQTSEEVTVTATSFPIPESSSTITFFFMSSDPVFSVEPTLSSTFVVSPSRSVSLMMPMSSSELTLSVSIFTPSVPSMSTSLPVTLTVLTPDISPSISALSEIFIAPTSTTLTTVDLITSSFTSVSLSSSQFSSSSISTLESSLLTPSFSDFFEPSSTPIFFVTTFTSSAESTLLVSDSSSPASLSPSVTVSSPISLSSSTMSSMDLTTFFPEPTTTVVLLTPNEVTSTPQALQPTSTIELPTTTTVLVIEPFSSVETLSVSSSLPFLTPTPIFSSSLPTTIHDITSSPAMTSIFSPSSVSVTRSPQETETFIFPTTTVDMLLPITPTPTSTLTSFSTTVSSSTPTLTPSISSPSPSFTSISMLSSISSSSVIPTTVLTPSLTISSTSTEDIITSTITPLVTIAPTPTPNITVCDSIDCRNGTCVDVGEDYLCDCYIGWTGQFCDIDIDYCLEDSQSSPCDPVGAESCIDGNSTYSCICLPGFTGRNCSEDIDECTVNPCTNNATCNNLLNTFSCTCASGYTGPLCEFLIDPCVPNPCKEGAVCINTGDGVFECVVVPPTTAASSSVPSVSISTSPVIPLSTFTPTPTPSSTFTPMLTPTPTPTNVNPSVLNPVGTILTNEGQLFQFFIPDDTFYDPESGTTDQLSLSLLDLRGNLLPNTTWVQLRYLQRSVAVIEGIPLTEQVSTGSITDYVFLLRAEDEVGGVAHDLVTIRVIPAAGTFENFLVVFFEGEFEVFNQNLTAKIELFMGLSSFGNPDSNDVYIGSFSSGSIAVSYRNFSISDQNCADFRAWLNSIFSNGAYTEAFISSLAPFVPTKEPQITGPCNISDTNPTSPSTIRLVNPTQQGNRVLLFATVIPAVLLAILCLAVGILALVLYRRRRSEREYLYNPEMRRAFLHRRPIILEGEADFPVRGRRPVVLTNDLAVRDEDENQGLHGRRPLLEEVDYESEPSDDEDEEIMTAPLTPRRELVLEDEPPEYIQPPIYSYARLRFL